MKFKLVKITIITILIILSCTPTYPPVNNKSKIIKLGNTEFTMKEVPGAKTNTMRLASWDGGNEEDIIPFWMAETELTSEVWTEVYVWATGDKNLNNIIDKDETQGLYTFVNSGKVENYDPHKLGWDISFDPSETKNKNIPIRFISWYDAVVFCNAITEYYNYIRNDTIFTTVYNIENTPIRSSRDKDVDLFTKLELETDNNTGFRLPTRLEWLCAAAYIDGKKWNNPQNASGDYSGIVGKLPANMENVPEIQFIRFLNLDYFTKYSDQYSDYAWHSENSDEGDGHIAHSVKTKKPNALGFSDMSGNIHEYIWSRPFFIKNKNAYVNYAVGGSYICSPSNISIKYMSSQNSTFISRDVGLRIISYIQ